MQEPSSRNTTPRLTDLNAMQTLLYELQSRRSTPRLGPVRRLGVDRHPVNLRQTGAHLRFDYLGHAMSIL